MLNCNYIVNGNTYTYEEFKQLILTKGMGVLLEGVESPSPLAKILVERYDITKMNESIMEMWARIELEKSGEKVSGFIDPKKAEEVLNAKGQLSDYSTQEQIRYNTYSGIALTGIVANFSKVIGYLFDATSPTEVLDTQTNAVYGVNSEEFRALMSSSDSPTVERFIEKFPHFKITGRDLPRLKKSFRFGGKLLDAFKRTSSDGETTFETIDTLINLAIDNVKMQKLHLLGITNTNANSFLTLLGLGLPLNTVSKIFKAPVIAAISEGRRWSKDFLEQKQEDLVTTFLESNSIDSLGAVLYEKNGEVIISGLDVKGLTNVIIERISSKELNEKYTSDEALEKLYKKELKPEEELLANIALLNTMSEILPIGMELFKHSMIYKGLRYLPNKLWQLTSLIDNIESLSHFKGEAGGTRRQLSSIATDIVIKTILENDPTVRAIEDKAEREKAAKKIAQSFVSEYKDILYTANNQVRANYINRVIRKTTSRKVEPSSGSIFANVTPLAIPHVRAMYRSAISFRNVVEQIFNVYSPTVQKFVENISKEANLFSAYDALDKSGEVSKEFIKFITSNMKFKLGDTYVTTYVSNKESYETPEGTITGVNAWKSNFTERVFDVYNSITDNEFINALEFRSRGGVKEVLIVADKINDDEVIEKIRDGFEQLYRAKEITLTNGEKVSGKELALDFFKYSLMTDSMYYEKTGFSLVFPPQWGLSFGSAFASRIESIIPKESYVTDVNLLSLKNKFLYQFLIGRTDLIGRFSGGWAVAEKKKFKNGKKKNVYSGVDYYTHFETSDKIKVVYDMKYSSPYSVLRPKFITGFNGEILGLIPTPGSNYSYYAKISDVRSPVYDFSNEDLNRSFNIDRLLTGKFKLVDANTLSGNFLNVKYGNYTLEIGDTIAVVDMNNVTPSEISYYKVIDAEESDKGIKYKLQRTSTEPLYETTEIQRAKTSFSKFFSIRTGSTVVIDSITQLTRPKAGKRSMDITAKIISPTETGAIALPFYSVTKALTQQEQQDMVDETRVILNREISSTTNVVVTKDIFDNIKRNPILYRGLVDLFYEKLNYIDSVLTPTKIAQRSPALVVALKEAELGVTNLGGAVLTKQENNTFTLPVTDALRSVKEGDIFYGGNGKYYFTIANESNLISMFQFEAPVLEELEKNMTVEDFLSAYNTINKC